MSKRVTIGKVRFSYLNVWEPSRPGNIDEGKYSVSLIIPKSNKQALDIIAKAIEAAKAEGVSKLGTKGAPKLPLRDGDAERAGDEAYAGSYFINARSSKKPGLVDRNKMPIMDPADIKSGDWGYACISFFAYNNNGNKGISCSLEHLMKTDDGESLGGGITAEAAFADVPVDGGSFAAEPDPFAEDDMLG